MALERARDLPGMARTRSGPHGSCRATGPRSPGLAPGQLHQADGAPDVEFEGYQFFVFANDHADFTPSGVIGNPFRASAEKGLKTYDRYADHLAAALKEFETVEVDLHNREWKQSGKITRETARRPARATGRAARPAWRSRRAGDPRIGATRDRAIATATPTTAAQAERSVREGAERHCYRGPADNAVDYEDALEKAK